MKLSARKSLLYLIVVSLSITAVLGIVSALWTGLGQTGGKILASAAAIDVAAVLALCCTARVKSAWHRAVQLTGLLSACLGLVAGICVIWWEATASGLREGILRAAVVLFILAAAAAHSCLMLRLPSHGRLARILVRGTILCTGASAELIANYSLFPDFRPGDGYVRALMVVLILDAFGTIMILLMHRFGPRRADAAPAESARPAPNQPDWRVPAVP
jgi:hypothetical protein